MLALQACRKEEACGVQRSWRLPADLKGKLGRPRDTCRDPCPWWYSLSWFCTKLQGWHMQQSQGSRRWYESGMRAEESWSGQAEPTKRGALYAVTDKARSAQVLWILSHATVCLWWGYGAIELHSYLSGFGFALVWPSFSALSVPLLCSGNICFVSAYLGGFSFIVYKESN